LILGLGVLTVGIGVVRRLFGPKHFAAKQPQLIDHTTADRRNGAIRVSCWRSFTFSISP
jgi:hypothetical protein